MNEAATISFKTNELGRFPFVRTDLPDHSRRDHNFRFNETNQILNCMHEGDGFSAKTLGKSLFHFKTDWFGHRSAGWPVLTNKKPAP